jgi:hypothetical protein
MAAGVGREAGAAAAWQCHRDVCACQPTARQGGVHWAGGAAVQEPAGDRRECRSVRRTRTGRSAAGRAAGAGPGHDRLGRHRYRSGPVSRLVRKRFPARRDAPWPSGDPGCRTGRRERSRLARSGRPASAGDRSVSRGGTASVRGDRRAGHSLRRLPLSARLVAGVGPTAGRSDRWHEVVVAGVGDTAAAGRCRERAGVVCRAAFQGHDMADLRRVAGRSRRGQRSGAGCLICRYLVARECAARSGGQSGSGPPADHHRRPDRGPAGSRASQLVCTLRTRNRGHRCTLTPSFVGGDQLWIWRFGSNARRHSDRRLVEPTVRGGDHRPDGNPGGGVVADAGRAGDAARRGDQPAAFCARGLRARSCRLALRGGQTERRAIVQSGRGPRPPLARRRADPPHAEQGSRDQRPLGSRRAGSAANPGDRRIPYGCGGQRLHLPRSGTACQVRPVAAAAARTCRACGPWARRDRLEVPAAVACRHHRVGTGTAHARAVRHLANRDPARPADSHRSRSASASATSSIAMLP